MKKTFLLFLIVSFLCSLQKALAQTNVGSIISTNTTWTASGNPYVVLQEIIVNKGVTLTIKPGVLLKFDGHFGIDVNGTLRAIGTPDSMITFTDNKFIPYTDRWGSIHFEDSSQDYSPSNQTGCIVQYCALIYAGVDDNLSYNPAAIHFTDASPLIDHCIVSYSSGPGIAGISGDSAMTITNNQLLNIEHPGMEGTMYINATSSVDISCNLFYNDEGEDFMISLYGACNFSNNIITGCQNSGAGFLFNDSQVKVTDNSIIDNYSPGGTMLIAFGDLTYNTITRNGGDFSNNAIVNYDSLTHINHNNIYGNKGASPQQEADHELSNAVVRQSPNTPATDATDNFWNKTTVSSIDSVIYDYYDDTVVTKVNFQPFLLTPDTLAPITPPNGVVKSDLGGGKVAISWDSNLEADIAGYRIYWGNPTGYSFSNSLDVGNVTSYTLSNASFDDTIAVTAYDHLADGAHDQCDGNESWFTKAAVITGISSEPDILHLTTFPNPASDQFIVSFTARHEAKVQLKLYDVLGRMLLLRSYIVVPGENYFLIKSSPLPSGLYTLQLDKGSLTKSVKVMIER